MITSSIRPPDERKKKAVTPLFVHRHSPIKLKGLFKTRFKSCKVDRLHLREEVVGGGVGVRGGCKTTMCRRIKILEEWELDNPLKMDNQVMTREASASSDYK